MELGCTEEHHCITHLKKKFFDGAQILVDNGARLNTGCWKFHPRFQDFCLACNGLDRTCSPGYLRSLKFVSSAALLVKNAKKDVSARELFRLDN